MKCPLTKDWCSFGPCLVDNSCYTQQYNMENKGIQNPDNKEESGFLRIIEKNGSIPHDPMTDTEEVFYMAQLPSTFKNFKLWYENNYVKVSAVEEIIKERESYVKKYKKEYKGTNHYIEGRLDLSNEIITKLKALIGK